MIARNFSLQDLPYSRLREVPDEEREYLTIDELKPHQLTELGVPTQPILGVQQSHQLQQNCLIQQVQIDPVATVSGYNHQQQQLQQQQQQQQQHHHHHHHHQHHQTHNIYYDSQQQQINGSSVSGNNSLYLGNNGDMTQNVHLSVMDSTMTEHLHLHQQQTQQQQQQQQQQQIHQHQLQTTNISKRKRKGSFNTEVSDLEDDTGDDAKSVRTNDDNKKQNHSEIEKRRRDKMNTYITELSAMVPMCHAMSRKLDKLTVLRMAVQHLKTIRGAVHSYTEGHYKPAFLSDQELKMLILQAADGFLFVVGCDRGRILYVSESVSQILNYSQGDLLGQSWFDILHPKDVAKVKEQLSSSDLSPRERLIDAKTMLPVKTDVPQGVSRLCPGARRSFFCRMKCKVLSQVKEENVSPEGHRRKKQLNNDKKYSAIQCTGYLKSWAPAKIGLEEQETDGDGESCNLSCLVAVGRVPPNIFQPNMQSTTLNNNPTLRTIQFISRHAMDGKFLFVDQRATLILGFLPQELLGTSMYEYYHAEDIPTLAESHKAALKGTEKISTTIYKFRTKEGGFIRLQSEWKSFRNPWTKELEYLIAKNAVILNDVRTMENNNYRNDGNNTVPGNFEFFNQSNGREMQRIINTHVGASKIGRQIAEQVLDYQRRVGDSSAESSPGPDTSRSNEPTMSQQLSSNESSLSTNELTNDQQNMSPALPTSSIPGSTPNTNASRSNSSFPGLSVVRNNPILSPDHASDSEIMHMMSGSAISEPNGATTTTDGNDEAAMAVIMSLLEADAGLGGPVDFTGLPWPLP